MAASAKQLAFTLCLIGLIAGSACAASNKLKYEDKLKYQILRFGERESNRQVLVLRMDLIYHTSPSAASGAPYSPPTSESEARYRASPGSPEAEFFEMADKILALVRVSAAAFDKEMLFSGTQGPSESSKETRKFLVHSSRQFDN